MMADTKPVEVRRNPDNPKQIAVKTGAGVTAGEWFVFDADNGGGYTNGEREQVSDWTKL
jgi:hypothetical protein